MDWNNVNLLFAMLKGAQCPLDTDKIHKAINAKGHEQEKQYLFPALYGDALTKKEKGAWSQFERKLKAGKFRVL